MDARKAASKHHGLVRLLLRQFEYATGGPLELSHLFRREVFARTRDLLECMVQLDFPAPPLLLFRDESEPVEYLQVAYPGEEHGSAIPIYHREKKTPIPIMESDRELIPRVLRKWIEVLEPLINPPSGFEAESTRQVTRGEKASTAAISAEARALAVLTDHPDWTDKRIAEAAGLSRTTLYGLPRFTAARAILKAGAPRPTDRRKGRTGKPLADTSPDTEADTSDDECREI